MLSDYELKAESARILAERTRLELARWLSLLPWDFFFLITHKKERRDAIYWTNVVGRALLNLPYVSRIFLATERGNLSPNSIHHHGLMWSGSKSVPVEAWFGGFPQSGAELWSWSRQRFGFSSFQSIKKIGGVSLYCSKYITKGTCEYGFFSSAGTTNEENAVENIEAGYQSQAEMWKPQPPLL